ncbi:hypothetical protein T07_12065 [Trichinella nelsoni]|uniref:Uncharacterized protein n=1 Tax=Trichinella nelsoni TaxID=6336 RepID=A0A0V0S820_9BILA|nr:hypothetical protein T07_12065 [Trichinella nelsoni]
MNNLLNNNCLGNVQQAYGATSRLGSLRFQRRQIQELLTLVQEHFAICSVFNTVGCRAKRKGRPGGSALFQTVISGIRCKFFHFTARIHKIVN